MKRLLLLAPLLCILGCDSTATGSTGSAGGGSGGSQLTAAATFTVGSDAMVPFVGGGYEPQYMIRPGSVPDTLDQATLNFLGSTRGGALKYSGSILVHGIAHGGTYNLDTAYFGFRGPGANLSFNRYSSGEDTCYYSSMSGTLHMTGWTPHVQGSTAGHLATGRLDAIMGFPWPLTRRRTCPETLSVHMEFTEAFIRDWL